MQRYSSYKDSGVKWLGEIPSHWETRILKYCCSLKGRIGWNGLKSEEFKDFSYAYLVTGQDFIGSEIDWTKCYQISQERYDEDPFIQLNNGDMLITKDGTIGKVAKVTNLDKPACLNSGIFVIKQKKNYFDQSFLYWMLCSNVLKEFNIYTQTGATIAHLYQNVFENMPCILPPLNEQQKIASFLDNIVGKIDEIIAQQQKMIELLNERKQIIINNAVTKGLDPNVKMKDSGVDWIGEIPEGWEVSKFKFHGYIKSGDSIKNEDVKAEGDFPVWGGNGLMGYHNKHNIENNAFVIGRVGALCGNVRYVETPVFVTDNALIFQILSTVEHKFLYYAMVAADFNKLNTSNAQPLITGTKVKNVSFAYPSYYEQIRIVEFVENKLKIIENGIDVITNQIALLQERKQIIINEVVTGKVKV